MNTQNIDQKKLQRAQATQGLGIAAGLVTGIVRKSGFWGTVGWMILGSMLFGAVGVLLFPFHKD